MHVCVCVCVCVCGGAIRAHIRACALCICMHACVQMHPQHARMHAPFLPWSRTQRTSKARKKLQVDLQTLMRWNRLKERSAQVRSVHVCTRACVHKISSGSVAHIHISILGAYPCNPLKLVCPCMCVRVCMCLYMCARAWMVVCPAARVQESSAISRTSVLPQRQLCHGGLPREFAADCVTDAVRHGIVECHHSNSVD